jgi:hypothetical protein
MRFLLQSEWSDRSAVDRGVNSQGTHGGGDDALRGWSEGTARIRREVAIANAFDNGAVEAACRLLARPHFCNCESC